MKENLEHYKGLPLAEAVMTKLVEKGMGRGDAHELVRKCAIKASVENKAFSTTLFEDKLINKMLNKKEIDHVLNPSNYLGAAGPIIEKIINKLVLQILAIFIVYSVLFK